MTCSSRTCRERPLQQQVPAVRKHWHANLCPSQSTTTPPRQNVAHLEKRATTLIRILRNSKNGDYGGAGGGGEQLRTAWAGRGVQAGARTGSRSRAVTTWPAAAMRRASCANPAVASRILSCLSDLALPDFPMALIKTSCCSAAPRVHHRTHMRKRGTQVTGAVTATLTALHTERGLRAQGSNLGASRGP